MNIQFGDMQLTLTGDGMIWIESARALIASDIHFEKSTFYSRFLTLLPPYDSNETLEKLEHAVQNYQPNIFIALGDSFHDRQAGTRMEEKLAARLNTLIASVPDWRWVTGNHDPDIAAHIQGVRMAETGIGPIVFRHELKTAEQGFEISGHFHPKLSVLIQNTHISAPCFVQAGNKVIMPAFGSFTGGLDVENDAFVTLVPAARQSRYLVHKGRVYKV